MSEFEYTPGFVDQVSRQVAAIRFAATAIQFALPDMGIPNEMYRNLAESWAVSEIRQGKPVVIQKPFKDLVLGYTGDLLPMYDPYDLDRPLYQDTRFPKYVSNNELLPDPQTEPTETPRDNTTVLESVRSVGHTIGLSNLDLIVQRGDDHYRWRPRVVSSAVFFHRVHNSPASQQQSDHRTTIRDKSRAYFNGVKMPTRYVHGLKMPIYRAVASHSVDKRFRYRGLSAKPPEMFWQILGENMLQFGLSDDEEV